MKQHVFRILAMFLVLVTLAGVLAVPVFATGYYMECTIFYKDEAGNQIATAVTFSMNAADTTAQNKQYASPMISGYSLKNSNDAYVTYLMMDKSFGSSHYIREGSATYTVYYIKNQRTTIYYKYSDGTTAATSKILTGNPNNTFSVTSPVITGYTASKTSCSGQYGSASQTVYYYENTYTVSYDANGGSGAPSSQTKAHFSDLTLSMTTPVRNGYVFVGWDTASGSTTALYQPGGTYSTNANVTLYAIWGKSQYTVTFYANGGSGAPSPQIKTHGEPLIITSEQPTRSGYTFLGWSPASSATNATYVAGDAYKSNKSCTLYAVWIKNQYTVTFYANGGSGAPSPQIKIHGEPLIITSEQPTRSGYTFLGWSPASSAISATYVAGDAYTSNKSCTLYAVWSCNHSTTTKIFVTGCNWERTCNSCGLIISTGTEHTSYQYGNWGNYSETQHRRTKNCSYDDYFSYEYQNHNISIEYKAYSNIQHKYYSYCSVCASMIGSEKYEEHHFTTTVISGRIISVCNECGYTQETLQTYTVSYHANGGSGAPASQTKTFGQSVTISSVQPTRTNHAFMGWATSSTATTPEYYGGETYSADASVTLYAVWVERNYDFSVSNLTISPNEVYQYEKISISFRTDSWDRNLPYDDIPVEVLLNGSVIYSTKVDFIKYGVQNFTFDLNVGALLGQQTLVARINWADHDNETRTTNNSVSTTFTVKKLIETSAESVSVSGEYVEGFEVISSFYVTNEAASDIIPSDGVSFDFVVYSMNGSSTNVVSQQTWNNVVIPAGGRNLVYFKWKVPAGSAGTTYFCKGTINPARADNETNSANNSTEFAVLAQSIGSSQTPNTHFESNAPSTYNPSVTAPNAKSGSATWNMWVYENGGFILKQYGVSVTSTDPDLLPSSACLTAEKVGNTWKMKSGYGVTLSWNPKLIAKSGYTMPGSDAYTSAQCIYATFPEYSYSTASGKYRTLELVNGNYQFVQNADADGNARVHFIPVYVDDGSYTVSVSATHIWTPAGMVSAVRNVKVNIDGTIYDDWYQG